jgi:uncharacterized protein (TIGR03435 family)
MANHATGLARAVLLTGAVWVAGCWSVWAQATIEAGAITSVSAGAGSKTGSATGKALGSALGGVGAKVGAATAAPAAPVSTTTTMVLPKTGAARGDLGGAGIITVTGPPPDIHFDEVSFQKCAGGVSSTKVDMPADGDYVSYHCQPILQMISFAYSGGAASELNLTGYPAWAATELFDMEGKVAPEDVSTWQKLGLSARKVAVRKLLANELKLKVHAKTNPKLVYTLSVAPSGPKLKEYSEGEQQRLPNGLTLTGRDMTWVGRVAYFQDTSMGALVEMLSEHLDHPVVNQTGLTRGYNFSLPLPHGTGTSAHADLAEHVPSVAESLAGLGLRLESGRGEVGALVVDHVEAPPSN